MLGLRSTLRVSGSRDARIAAIAARQRGRVSRRQLLDAGLSEGQIASLVRHDRLFSIYAGVYAVGHPGAVALGVQTAALLAVPQALLSNRCAGGLWGLVPLEVNPDVVDLLVGSEQHVRRPGIRVHRSRFYADAEPRLREGLSVTSPAYTLLDLATELGGRELQRAHDEALVGRLLGPGDCERILARLPKHPGASALRAMLVENGPDSGATESAAEELLRSLLGQTDLPRARRQVWIEGYRVDCFWPDARLAVEIDGFGVHSTRRRFESDRVRDARLAAVGIEVLRVTWRQMKREPLAVIARIAAAYARRAQIER